MRKHALMAVPGPFPGSVEISRWITPDFSAGDAQFLDSDAKRHVQLRPILDHEKHPGRSYGPSDLMLVCRGFGPREFRAFVRMRPGDRANTPRNVAYAVQQIEGLSPGIGAFFRAALAGRDPFVNAEQAGR
jgi:hypothetical protein